MRLFNHICDCGSPMTAIVELDSKASGGYMVRFSDDLGKQFGLNALGVGSSRLCPGCKRRIGTNLKHTDEWSLVRQREHKDQNSGEFILRDISESEGYLPVGVFEGGDGVLWIRPKGYGDNCSVSGAGLPIGLALNEGRLEVYLWDDINEEDHKTIDMSGANEDTRVEEVCPKATGTG